VGLVVAVAALALLLLAGCTGLGAYLWLNHGSNKADGSGASDGGKSTIANDTEQAKSTAFRSRVRPS
jgi:hypothetical protein